MENPNFVLSHTDAYILYQGSGRITSKRAKPEFIQNCSNPFHGILAGNYVIITCTVVCKKTVLLKPPDEDIICNVKNLQGDLPIWLSIEITSIYRRSLGSDSNPTSRQKEIAFQESSKRIRLEFARKYNVPRVVMRQVEDMYYDIMITKGYHLNDKELIKYFFNRLHKKR